MASLIGRTAKSEVMGENGRILSSFPVHGGIKALADLARLLFFSLCGITGKMVFTL